MCTVKGQTKIWYIWKIFLLESFNQIKFIISKGNISRLFTCQAFDDLKLFVDFGI